MRKEQIATGDDDPTALEQSEGNASGDASAAKGVAAKKKEEAEPERVKPKAKVKAKATTPKVQPSNEKETRLKAKAAQARKDLDAKLKGAANINSRYTQACSDVSSILASIATVEAWYWAKADVHSADLKSAHEQLENHVRKTKFSQDWRMKSQAELKKDYEGGALSAHLDSLVEVEIHLKCVEEEIESMKAINRIRMNRNKSNV